MKWEYLILIAAFSFFVANFILARKTERLPKRIHELNDNSESEYDDRDALCNKIEGLEVDLDIAFEVYFKMGATEWVQLNYPEHYKRLTEPKR